jgi:D-alanyl-D-alanine carboxypeptidase
VASQANPSLRSPLQRFATAIVLTLGLIAGTTLAAEAANLRQFAGIVVDAKSGKTLFEQAADAPRYPASVTKVMTLYVLFQELAAGNVKLSTEFSVSQHAASASPTKLGLRAGSKITVENAIKSIVTISANDMARVIAENLSGSESAFADRMTRTARALGMNHTVYYNASGLPDPRQVTTVRDQSRLAIAVYQHFPQYYSYFQTRSFAYGKRVYGSHDRLLGQNGVDGLKTGYTGAAGFNLMTASRLDNRHIVVIGFGFDSSSLRDNKVMQLVKTYLPKGRQGGYTQTAMIPAPGHKGGAPKLGPQDGNVQVAEAAVPKQVAPMPAPSFRTDPAQPDIQVAAYAVEPDAAQLRPKPSLQTAVIDNPRPSGNDAPLDLGVRPAVEAANQLGGPSAAPRPADRLDVTGKWINDTFRLGAPPAALGATRPSAPLVPPVGVGAKGQPLDLMTSGSIGQTQVAQADAAPKPAAAPVQLASATVQAPTPASSNTPGWVVQIGAAPSEDGANQLLSTASTKLATLTDFRPYVERFEKNGQTYFRARFVGFGDRDAATSACNELKRAKMSCLALQG